jgi:hypothetical protein
MAANRGFYSGVYSSPSSSASSSSSPSSLFGYNNHNNNTMFTFVSNEATTATTPTMLARNRLNNLTNTFQQQQHQPSPLGMISRKSTVDYCTFCYKTDPVLASTHRLKDELDRITCTVLLNNTCTFCHNLGHTPKNCPEVKKRNKKRQIQRHLMSIRQENGSSHNNSSNTSTSSSSS